MIGIDDPTNRDAIDMGYNCPVDVFERLFKSPAYAGGKK
jgi:hypothetical protein